MHFFILCYFTKSSSNKEGAGFLVFCGFVGCILIEVLSLVIWTFFLVGGGGENFLREGELKEDKTHSFRFPEEIMKVRKMITETEFQKQD